MKETLERALLMAVGLSIIAYAISGPISQAVNLFEEKRAINCVNTALKSLDLAISNSLGGGTAVGYVYLPCYVTYEASGGNVRIRSGNYSASISYPFEVEGGGGATGYGRFVAIWKAKYISIRWEGNWRKD